MEQMTVEVARRVALAAQGFASGPPSRPGLRQLRSLAARLGAIQIDAVNVLIRTQYLPAFSRLGPYDRRALDELTYQRRELFEYDAHAASLVPVSLHPLLRWRMEMFAAMRWWGESDHTEAVLAEVAARGPLTPAELSDPGTRGGPWFDAGKGKRALAGLAACGRLMVAERRGAEIAYDVPERVLPSAILDAPTPEEADARRELMALGARALGIGTAKDIADYFRIGSQYENYAVRAGWKRGASPKRLIQELVEDARLVPARVEGWGEEAYLDTHAKAPRSIEARALLSPFDPLIWERSRTERLFGFRYRVEIYVPSSKREYGYYVLPFLLGDALVARVDLKSDRKRSALIVQGAFAEDGIERAAVSSALGERLRAMATWLQLEKVEVAGRGDMARQLRRCV